MFRFSTVRLLHLRPKNTKSVNKLVIAVELDGIKANKSSFRELSLTGLQSVNRIVASCGEVMHNNRTLRYQFILARKNDSTKY